MANMNGFMTSLKAELSESLKRVAQDVEESHDEQRRGVAGLEAETLQARSSQAAAATTSAEALRCAEHLGLILYKVLQGERAGAAVDIMEERDRSSRTPHTHGAVSRQGANSAMDMMQGMPPRPHTSMDIAVVSRCSTPFGGSRPRSG